MKNPNPKDNWPRVSQVLQPYTDYSMVPEHVLTRKTEIGRTVHQYCAGIAQGLWMPQILPECAGYITSFQNWFDTYVEEVIFLEKELSDPVYHFIGHLDFYGRLKKLGLALLDWKTPITLYKQWKVQLASYKRLLDVIKRPVDLIASLQLNPEGKIPKMTRYQDSAEDLNIFLGLLNGHNYFKRG